MAVAQIINFSVPESFLKKLEEFEIIIEKDKEFKDALGRMCNRYNKKNNNNKLRSAKFRYAILYYIRDRKRKVASKIKEKK